MRKQARTRGPKPISRSIQAAQPSGSRGSRVAIRPAQPTHSGQAVEGGSLTMASSMPGHNGRTLTHLCHIHPLAVRWPPGEAANSHGCAILHVAPGLARRRARAESRSGTQWPDRFVGTVGQPSGAAQDEAVIVNGKGPASGLEREGSGAEAHPDIRRSCRPGHRLVAHGRCGRWFPGSFGVETVRHRNAPRSQPTRRAGCLQCATSISPRRGSHGAILHQIACHLHRRTSGGRNDPAA
jgi:hypothetical protein